MSQGLKNQSNDGGGIERTKFKPHHALLRYERISYPLYPPCVSRTANDCESGLLKNITRAMWRLHITVTSMNKTRRGLGVCVKIQIATKYSDYNRNNQAFWDRDNCFRHTMMMYPRFSKTKQQLSSSLLLH